jgi:hypothetical protein
LKGLSLGDRVIVDGLQRVGPGAVVAPEEVKTLLATQSEKQGNAK